MLPVHTPVRTGLARSLEEALEGRRLFILLPFGMVAGVVGAANLPVAPQAAVLIAGAAAFVGAIAAAWRNLVMLRLLTLLASAWVGLCLLPIGGLLWGTPMLMRPAFGTYQARVDEIIEADAKEQRVVLSAVAPDGSARALPVRRARVLIRGAQTFQPGDRIGGSFRFAPVPGPVLPGGFDPQFHAHFDGIGAYGNSTKPPQIVGSGDPASLDRITDGLRRTIAARIDAVLPQPTAGVARAIINGDQSEVGDDVRTTMATAGIAHVLSVSGLHLTIVAGGAFWVLRLVLAGFPGIGRRVPVKRLAALGGIAAALFYYGISGGNVAALRSTLMIVLVFGAVLFGRRALTMRNIAIAGMIVVATDPASVFRPSFQLSFAAVIALVGAYENYRSERSRDASLIAHAFGYLKGIAITSLVAGVATLVFSIYHFQQTSPLGILGNLATLPLVGFVMMPAAAVAVLAMPFGIEQPFLLAMGWSVERMLDMAKIVSALSEHLRAAPLLTPLALVASLAALAWFAFFRDRWRLLGPLAMVPVVLLFAIDRPPDVLVADTTQAIAIRGSGGLELAAGKDQSFALDVWRDTYSDPIVGKAVESCDSSACIGTSTVGFSFALVTDPAAFEEECGRADLIVTRGTAPSWCASKAVIDGDDLLARGTYWLHWNAATETFDIRTAISPADQPWRIRP
ncbi:MAG: ComEC/Rec2 family competence protein [Devosia sp.]